MSGQAISARNVNATQQRRRQQALRLIVLSIVAAFFLAPIYWMLSTSLKPESETIALPLHWVPVPFTLKNYLAVLNAPDGSLIRWTFNSVFAGVAYTVLHVALCILTAYPLARMHFRGRDAWFWFILSSMMIPGVLFLIPQYMMMIRFNWIDTFHALIWPGVADVFGVFLLRQFFLTIPRDFEDAARMDGASYLQVLTYVMVPISQSAVVTLSIFSFMGSWNNYVWPLFVVHGSMLTLPVGLTEFSSRYVTEYGKLMAGTAIASLPVLVAFLFAQRFFVQGLTLGGLKE